MFNAMKYTRNLEAVGFERNQAEAQVQMVVDMIEGELVTKSDFSAFQDNLNGRLENLELRIITKIGFMIVSCASITIAVLTWLIKIH